MARSIDDLVEDFELFEDWEERYRYIVDLGKKLPPMPEDEQIKAGIAPGMVRLSLGLTGTIEQRWSQLEQALDAVGA